MLLPGLLSPSSLCAGGLATYMHADKWAQAMPEGVRVAAMPDSGFFLDYQGLPADATPVKHTEYPAELEGQMSDVGPGVYQSDMKWVFQQQNVTSGPF